MILADSKESKILENIIKNEKITPNYASVNNGGRINIEFCGSDKQRLELEKELEKINLKLQRSADYYSSLVPNSGQRHEICAVDGKGNDTLTTYCYSHKEAIQNPSRK